MEQIIGIEQVFLSHAKEGHRSKDKTVNVLKAHELHGMLAISHRSVPGELGCDARWGCSPGRSGSANHIKPVRFGGKKRSLQE
jgi:hypothetical protein